MGPWFSLKKSPLAVVFLFVITLLMVSLNSGCRGIVAAAPTPPAAVVATTTTLSADVNPAPVGVKVTFTAKVVPADATGNVTFTDGSTTLGSAALGSGGTASLSTSTLAPGSHSITASYAGNATRSASTSAALTEVIQTAASLQSINHVIVMLQENRSFDSYFGKLGDYRAANGYGAATDIDGLPSGVSNPMDKTDSGVINDVSSYHFQ